MDKAAPDLTTAGLAYHYPLKFSTRHSDLSATGWKLEPTFIKALWELGHNTQD